MLERKGNVQGFLFTSETLSEMLPECLVGVELRVGSKSPCELCSSCAPTSTPPCTLASTVRPCCFLGARTVEIFPGLRSRSGGRLDRLIEETLAESLSGILSGSGLKVGVARGVVSDLLSAPRDKLSGSILLASFCASLKDSTGGWRTDR